MDFQNLQSIFQLNNVSPPKLIEIGGEPIVVFDDFFKFPEKVADIANCLDYSIGPANGVFKNYPGERAVISISQSKIVKKLKRILVDYNADYEFADSPTIFTRMNEQLLRKIDSRQMVPHIDTNSKFSVIIHLHNENTKTNFFEHKDSGLVVLPNHPTKEISDLMESQNFDPLKSESYLQFIKFLMMKNSREAEKFSGWTGYYRDTPTWKIIESIPANWNRLVCFPSRIFHSPVYRPKHQSVSSRLTMNLFLKNI